MPRDAGTAQFAGSQLQFDRRHLKQAMRLAGISIDQLAQKMDMAPRSIKRWLMGASVPHASNLKKMYEALEISPLDKIRDPPQQLAGTWKYEAFDVNPNTDDWRYRKTCRHVGEFVIEQNGAVVFGSGYLSGWDIATGEPAFPATEMSFKGKVDASEMQAEFESVGPEFNHNGVFLGRALGGGRSIIGAYLEKDFCQESSSGLVLGTARLEKVDQTSGSDSVATK